MNNLNENLPLFKKNQEKKEHFRNPNIDFIRIFGMLAIVIHHFLLHGKAMVKYKSYIKLRLLNIICTWHVGSFGVISGIVGNNKSHKYSNLLYLWIITIFYLLLFYLKNNILKTHIIRYNFISLIFPVIHNKYWYFSSYFGIYPFLPFINTSISYIPQITFKKSVYFMISIFIIWASCYGDVFSQNSGHSPFSLLIFYIFGKYIGKYIFYIKHGTRYRILICIICIVIFISISLLSYNIYIKNYCPYFNPRIKNIFHVSINSFPMLLQVISFTIFSAQLQFNNFFSRVLKFIGPLTFDVYLIHDNPYIRNTYISLFFNKYSSNLNILIVFLLVIKGSFYIFGISIFIGYIRNKIFRFIKIKELCITFETIITKIMYYLI